MTDDNLTIDRFLTPFVPLHQSGKPLVTVMRIDRLDRILRQCIEAQEDGVHCLECRALLLIEKAFNSVNPVASALSVDRLLFALGAYVHSPWLQSDVAMQAEQWRFVRAIVDAVERTPEFDQRYMTPQLERQIVMLREHVSWGLRRSSQARKPRGAR